MIPSRGHLRRNRCRCRGVDAGCNSDPSQGLGPSTQRPGELTQHAWALTQRAESGALMQCAGVSTRHTGARVLTQGMLMQDQGAHAGVGQQDVGRGVAAWKEREASDPTRSWEGDDGKSQAGPHSLAFGEGGGGQRSQTSGRGHASIIT